MLLGLPLPLLKSAYRPDIQQFLSQLEYIQTDIIFSRSLSTHDVRRIRLKYPRSDGDLLTLRRGIMLALEPRFLRSQGDLVGPGASFRRIF